MPVWDVTEPFINLWVKDSPLAYQPAVGPRISLALLFKQRESVAGMNTNVFGTGKKWNCSWLSFVAYDGPWTRVHYPGGQEGVFTGTNDYRTNIRLTGNSATGFALLYPDGRKDVYGLIVTNSNNLFLKAFLSETWNAIGQKTRLDYDPYTSSDTPVIRLKYIVDGDGRTNSISYVTDNAYSTNLISEVTDPFGRSVSLAYDPNGHLTNITDVAGIQSSLRYDQHDWVTNLTTPYGTNSFLITDTPGGGYLAPNGRSVLVTEPDGSKQLFLYTNGAPGIASSYASGEVPTTSPYANTFENSDLHLRNSFHWGRQQYAALSTTTITSFTADDFRKARMRHWLNHPFENVSSTLSLSRNHSPDDSGATAGQKTWFDYAGKTNNNYQGTQFRPLFTAQVLPDGSTWLTRTARNNYGSTTNEAGTYSVGATVYLRTNSFVYAANGVDLTAMTNAVGRAGSEQCLQHDPSGGDELQCVERTDREYLRQHAATQQCHASGRIGDDEYLWLRRFRCAAG